MVNNLPKIILISGKAQHGKDTTAAILKEKIETEGKKAIITHYADLVKYVCKTFFNWDGNKDDKGRTLLQYVGTDIVRKQSNDYWVKFIYEMITFFGQSWDYILIPDCRFPNEVDYFRNSKFETVAVRVIREEFESLLTKEQQKHPSEIALDNYDFDYVISAHDTDTLRKEVERLWGKIVCAEPVFTKN